MPGSTTPRGFPYSSGSDLANTIDNTMQSLATAVDLDTRCDVIANRGSATRIGEKFYATDTGDLWLATATGSGNWVQQSSVSRIEFTTAGSTVSGGYLPLATTSTASGPITWTLGTFPASGVSNSRVEISLAGLYRVSLTANTTGDFIVAFYNSAGSFLSGQVRAIAASGSASARSASGLLRATSTYRYLTVLDAGGSAGSYILPTMAIERVGP